MSTPQTPQYSPSSGTKLPPNQSPNHSASPVAAPGRPPLPKRPKGRWFVGVSLGLLILFSSYTIWNGVLRYPVRGVVVGRTIEVSPPWEATIASLHVREGDAVKQGQLLVTLESRELQELMASVSDELKLAQAELEAKVTQLRWQSQQRHDWSQQAQSDLYQVWGELSEERSKQEIADGELARLEAIRAKNADAVSGKQLDEAKLAAVGQQAKVRKLETAVEQLKHRVEVYGEVDQDATTQFQPELLKIENLKAEIQRTRDKIAACQIRSPISGVIAKLPCDTGERADVEHALAEIVEDGTLETVLYVPQEKIAQLELGQVVHVRIEPYQQPVACRVMRRGVRMEPPPASLERFYDDNERLLPVYAKPDCRTIDTVALSIGSEARLPRRWLPWFESTNALTGMARANGSTRTIHVPSASSKRSSVGSEAAKRVVMQPLQMTQPGVNDSNPSQQESRTVAQGPIVTEMPLVVPTKRRASQVSQ